MNRKPEPQFIRFSDGDIFHEIPLRTGHEDDNSDIDDADIIETDNFSPNSEFINMILSQVLGGMFRGEKDANENNDEDDDVEEMCGDNCECAEKSDEESYENESTHESYSHVDDPRWLAFEQLLRSHNNLSEAFLHMLQL